MSTTLPFMSPAAMKRIELYLKDHFGAADPAVMAAFQAVPREYYHYEYPERRATPGVGSGSMLANQFMEQRRSPEAEALEKATST